ncbi:MAG: hypothetical protein R3B70_28910, partial [Polyangiaceae bacterium]
MSPLLTLMLWARRVARFLFPVALALGLGALVVLDAAGKLPEMWAIGGIAAIGLVFSHRLVRRMRGTQ